MTSLNVLLNVLVHSRPVVALENPFFCFHESIVSSKEMSVSVFEHFRHELGWQKDHYSAWFKSSLHSSPDDVVFDEGVVGEMFDDL